MSGLGIDSVTAIVAVLFGVVFGSGGLFTALKAVMTVRRQRKQIRLFKLQIEKLEEELAATRGRIVKPTSQEIADRAPPRGIEVMDREAARQQEVAASGGGRKPLSDLSALLLGLIFFVSCAGFVLLVNIALERVAQEFEGALNLTLATIGISVVLLAIMAFLSKIFSD